MWLKGVAAALLLAAGSVGDGAGQIAETGGALRHEQVSIPLSLGSVELRVTPLDESVVRLTAPDVRRRLRTLALLTDATTTGRRASFLVTFTASSPDQRVSPTELRFEVGGRRLNVAQIHPVTAGWGEQRLNVREPQAAVYVLHEEVDPFTSLRVSYGEVHSDAWRYVIPLLRAEERRVETSGDGSATRHPSFAPAGFPPADGTGSAPLR